MHLTLFNICTDEHKRECIVLRYGYAITVYKLNNEPFNVSKDRLVFFSNNKGQLLAFQIDPEITDPEDVSDALKFYAKYINNPEMDIQLTDPRPLVN